MPRKKDEALHAVRRQQILDAAKQCFVEHGFHGTSMRQILDAAGISSGGAYNYFASKDDIVKALVAEERADIDLLMERLQKAKDPLAGITQLVFDAIAHTDHDDAALAAEVYAEACRNPDVEKLTRENTDAAKRIMHETLLRGVKIGAITRRYSAADLTEWLLALIEGYIGRVAANPGLKPRKAARMAKNSVVKLLGETK